MEKWVEVVTHPLGLAGFALFLVFGAAARYGMRRDRRWLPAAAVGMALLALIGGLVLSWNSLAPGPTRKGQPGTESADAPKTVEQSTQGAQSPAVQGVGGNVTINVGGDKERQ